jgi:hypothetical protein
VEPENNKQMITLTEQTLLGTNCKNEEQTLNIFEKVIKLT